MGRAERGGGGNRELGGGTFDSSIDMGRMRF